MPKFVALHNPTLRGKSFAEEVELGATSLSNLSISSGFSVESLPGVTKSRRKPQLNPLSQAGIVVVLDEVVNMLQTIQTGFAEYIHPSWRKPFRYRTPAQRFTLNEEEKAQLQEDLYEMILTDRQKVQKDITLVVTSTVEIISQVYETGRYDILTDTVNGLRQHELDNTNFLEVDKHNRKELVKIRKKIEEEGKQLRAILEELIEEALQMDHKLQDTYLYSKEEVRYTEDFERARRAQSSRILEKAEAVLDDHIAAYEVKKEHENRVSAEIQAYINEDTTDMQDAIELWMNRYDEEIERKDHELQVQKMRWEDLNKAHVKLQELHEEHKQFIIDRKAELKERRRLARLFKRQTKAAVKIQAWWRGLLVRRMKGPYKWLKKFKRLRKIELAEKAAAGLAGLKMAKKKK